MFDRKKYNKKDVFVSLSI